MSARSLAPRDTTALILAAACWGVATVISKRALDEIAPLALLPIQLASSLLLLGVLMRRRGVPLRGSPVLLARLGILNPGLAYALSLLGLAYISASLSVVMWAIEPILILLLAVIVLRERITARLAVFSAAALAGMVLVVYDPAVEGQLVGVVLTLAGVACCAIYTVVARRFVDEADSTAQVVLAQQAHALGFAALVAAGAAILGADLVPTDATPLGLASAAVSGVLYYAAAYWLYLGALRAVPASVAATSFYLIPVFGVAAGFVLLGERLDPAQWVGAAVVVGSVIAIVAAPHARADNVLPVGPATDVSAAPRS